MTIPLQQCRSLVVHIAALVSDRWKGQSLSIGCWFHRRLEMAEEGGDWAEAWRGSGTVAKVGDLAAGRDYSFRVAASSTAGEGPFSRPTATRTLLQPPQPPHCLSLQPTQE